ncbi:MAG: DUF350 domain-containing protein [Austwickia sp.]|nr:DUF350 domain-containing protein [Actinomycetota bacterium]MCO5308134.1 DUF350 domain-containing protein [Austwickia sp.]
MVTSLLFGAAYALLGVVLLVAGFFVFDALTPGRLGSRIYEARSMNAAIIVAAIFMGLGAIEAVAIYTNGAANFGSAFGWTAGFGVVGILLQAISFLILDAVTPGSLREIAVDDRFHPGALVAAASQLAVSLVICASIS